MHSLRIKTTAITIAAIIASMIAFGAMGFFTVGRETSAGAGEKMHLISENAQKSLDLYLKSIEQSVMMTSRYTSDSLDAVELVENGANQTPAERSEQQSERLDAYLAQHCERAEDMLNNVARTTSGVVAYYYCLAPDISTEQHGFYYSRLGKVGFEKQDPLVASELDRQDEAHDGWYYSTVERGFPSWIGPYPAEDLGDALVVSFCSPIYRSGILIGVVGMDILFDTMIDQIADLEVYQSGFAFLVDSKGDIVYHPDLPMGEKARFGEEVLGPGGFGRESSGVATIRYNKNGSEWQLAFSTLANGEKLVVTAPVSEIVASWRHLLQGILFLAVGILAIFAAISMSAMRAVTRPLQQLTEAAHELAAGEYDVELDYHRNDEVGELTDAFRRLSDHLRIYISNLNSRSFTDDLTEAKNEGAYTIYAARLDDEIARPESFDELSFAVVVLHCMELKSINEAFGHTRGDEHLRVAYKLIAQIFSRSTVFRMSGDEFVVLLEDRDYANRHELLVDFEIMADQVNRRAEEPWQRIYIAKGLADFLPGEDTSLGMVRERAEQMMREDRERKGL